MTGVIQAKAFVFIVTKADGCFWKMPASLYVCNVVNNHKQAEYISWQRKSWLHIPKAINLEVQKQQLI